MITKAVRSVEERWFFMASSLVFVGSLLCVLMLKLHKNLRNRQAAQGKRGCEQPIQGLV